MELASGGTLSNKIDQVKEPLVVKCPRAPKMCLKGEGYGQWRSIAPKRVICARIAGLEICAINGQ